MNSHDGANISCKISSASSDSEVFRWIEPVGVDHEIPVIFIDRRRFTPVPIIEEFPHGLLFQCVDSMHIEPGRIAGEDDCVRLCYQMRSCRGLYGGLGLC